MQFPFIAFCARKLAEPSTLFCAIEQKNLSSFETCSLCELLKLLTLLSVGIEKSEKNRNQYWRLGKSTRYSLCGFLNLIYFAHIKIVTTAVELINFLQSLNYALSHFTKRNSSRCFFSLYYLLNIFSFIFLPRSRQGRWRSEVFLALEIWYLHWSLLLTRAEYFSEPNKLKASARFTFILFECRLSVKSLINSPHTGLKAFSLSFEFQFTYDLTNAAIRAHDECIRISPLNCRQKPRISYRLREKREEKLLMSNTNTHSRRGRFHIFFSLGDFRNGGKFESMKHDFSFFFKSEISFVFLFYRLKNWLTRFATHPHRHALEFKLFRHFTAWALAEASTDSNRLLFTATQQEIKNSFSYCSGGLSKSARRATAHDWWGDIRLGKSGSIHSFGKQFWGVR